MFSIQLLKKNGKHQPPSGKWFYRVIVIHRVWFFTLHEFEKELVCQQIASASLVFCRRDAYARM